MMRLLTPCQWDSVIMQLNDEPLAMIQAAVLGQTFALLSGVGNFQDCLACLERSKVFL